MWLSNMKMIENGHVVRFNWETEADRSTKASNMKCNCCNLNVKLSVVPLHLHAELSEELVAQPVAMLRDCIDRFSMSCIPQLAAAQPHQWKLPVQRSLDF